MIDRHVHTPACLLHVQQNLIGRRTPDAAVTIGDRQDISACPDLDTTLVCEVGGRTVVGVRKIAPLNSR
ncbi:MAG: hypothetical protein ACRDSR_10640 [Pseudonocardiaceae bacterium]